MVPPLPNTYPLACVMNTFVSRPLNRILTEQLERCDGGKVDIADLGARYRAVCKAEGRKSVSQGEFIDLVGTFCAKVGIELKAIEGRPHLMNVRLVAKADEGQTA